jgi:hypothetical protein
MDISSSFSSGPAAFTALNGLSQNAKRIEVASEKILRQTTNPEQGDPTESLESAIVELGIAEIGYKANAKVLKAQDEMNGALLDIIS